MEPFLKRLARTLLQHHHGRLDKIAVVLPGKRAGLHLRRFLAHEQGGPLWSPDILDMGAFLARSSGLEQGSSMEMLILFYDTYRSLRGAEGDTLADLLEWAPTTLRDMSEVDSHLLDLATLYKDLRNYHELEEWSFNLGELSPAQQRTNTEWRATGDLHRALHERMRQERVATSGFIARVCAENTKENLPLPWEFIWFAGLNALDPATSAVIAQLKAQGRAEVVWDTDLFYLDDPAQEAGRYLRRSIAQLGTGPLPAQNAILERRRHIRLVEAPHPMAQAAYVAQRLSELTAEERSHTAVVLAQEDLLLPLLQRMPADMGPVNVTMGLPLTALPVHGLTENYLEALAQASATRAAVHPLITLFAHPFLREGSATDKLLDALREQPRLHIETDSLFELIAASGAEHSERMIQALSVAGDHTRINNGFSALFDAANECAPDDPVVREQLFLMARLQQRMDRLLERTSIRITDLRAYRSIRERLLREERLAFLGEPLRGLQVLGMLETRTVDHDRLIVVGMNEGILPRTDAPTSWIPFDLRKHHRLPLPADAEAVMAYNFNRAMQLTHDVEWVHTAGSGGEPSRFVAQWQHEIIGRSGTTMDVHRVSPAPIVRGMRPVQVVKDEYVQTRLRALCERGLSPSALGTWLRCPLDFYFKYVAGIRDNEVVDGRLGSDVLGDAVHKTLERILIPHVGHELSPTLFGDAHEQVTRLLTDELAEHLPRAALEQGHYRLRRDMAAKALQNYLDAERERCSRSPTRLVAVELEVSAALPNGVVLKGRCDRIEERNGRKAVLDVKTGTVRDNDLRLPDLERASIGPNRRYALQLLIYLWAYLRQHPEEAEASAGVIPLQRAAQAAAGEWLQVGGETIIHRQQLPAIETLLVQLVDEMLDPAIPFTHDADSTYCRCCVA